LKIVNSTTKVVSQKEETRGAKPSAETMERMALLQNFYDRCYKPCLADDEEPPSSIHLSTSIDYMSADVVTMFENNVKQHFIEYVERYVDVVHRKKERIEEIKGDATLTSSDRKSHINELNIELRKVKNDLLTPTIKETINSRRMPLPTKTSMSRYHVWIDTEQSNILPSRPLQNDSVAYDLECKNCLDYLQGMIFMMKIVEEHDCSLFNVFPLRSEIIPKNFRIDSTTLANLLYSSEGSKKRKLEGHSMTWKEAVKKENQTSLWSLYFKTDKKCFHVKKDTHNYTFHHQIETDGVSCSILLIRKDKAGSKVGLLKKPSKADIANQKDEEDKYIDDLSPEERNTLQHKKVVGIDPNMSDLIFCVDSDTKDQHKFRYTQNQRRKETKGKKYRGILLNLKRTTVVEDKSVQDWEIALSKFNKKSLKFYEFQEYLREKNSLNKRLGPFYNAYLFRKLKLGRYIRKQKSESKLIKNFKEKFGPPEDVVIGYGDCDWNGNNHRGPLSCVKFHEPTKSSGFRKLFQKAGMALYLYKQQFYLILI
jgi:hypothetical protein